MKTTQENLEILCDVIESQALLHNEFVKVIRDGLMSNNIRVSDKYKKTLRKAITKCELLTSYNDNRFSQVNFERTES